MPELLQALPIDAVMPQIMALFTQQKRLIVAAEAGAGKTTRVPPALLATLDPHKKVLVLEPRRLAARLSARRVAYERGWTLGAQVGYQVRFDSCVGPDTRLIYMTEGVFVRQFVAEPKIEDVGCVVLDEFHERHLDADLALALLWRLMETRRDLSVVVMSATLDTQSLASYLDDAPVVHSTGRQYHVEIEHAQRASEQKLGVQVANALRRTLAKTDTGDALVFLPGTAEIRRCHDSLEDVSKTFGVDILPLHGELSTEAQDRAVHAGPRRKVVLATNIAETSLTIDNIGIVVDSGVARIAGHQAWSGLPTLELKPVSQAACQQRAGRAGRCRDGVCIRLYTAADFASRRPFEDAEILRHDLSELLLTLARLDIRVEEKTCALKFLQDPPDAKILQSRALLVDMGILETDGSLSALGQQVARFPLHPRLGLFLHSAVREGAYKAACTVAAILSERDVLARQTQHGRTDSRSTSILWRLELVEKWQQQRHAVHSGELDVQACTNVVQVAKRLQALRPNHASKDVHDHERNDAIRKALLHAFCDRVAQRRKTGKRIVMASGGEAEIHDDDIEAGAFMIVAAARESRHGTHLATHAHLTASIQAEWLLDLLPERVSDDDTFTFDDKSTRVTRHNKLSFGQLTLLENSLNARRQEQTAKLLLEAIKRRGLHCICDVDRLNNWCGRLQLAAKLDNAVFSPLAEEDLDAAVLDLCMTCISIDEVKKADLLSALTSQLNGQQQHKLSEMCPTHLTLPGRQRTPVLYDVEGKAAIASSIQDFFGLEDTPRIAHGRITVQVQLLAPNRRPVQLTQDLKGFWLRHYPTLRKQLCRRYPKHRWPEDPLAPQTKHSPR